MSVARMLKDAFPVKGGKKEISCWKFSAYGLADIVDDHGGDFTHITVLYYADNSGLLIKFRPSTKAHTLKTFTVKN